MASQLSLSPDELRRLDFYYNDQGNYEVFVSANTKTHLHVFVKNGNRIWSGSYSSGMTSIDVNVIAHKTDDGRILLVVKDNAQKAYAVDAGAFDGKDRPIPGSEKLKDSPFIRHVLVELAAEIVWQNNHPTIIDVNKQAKWLLIKMKRKGEDKKFVILHYNDDRDHKTAAISVHAADNNISNEEKLITKAMRENGALAVELDYICHNKSSSLISPCAYFIAGDTPKTWLFGMHEENNKIQAYLSWSDVSAKLEPRSVKHLSPRALHSIRGSEINALFGNTLDVLNAKSEVIKIAFHLGHPKRLLLLERGTSAGTRYVASVEDVISDNYEPFSAIQRQRSCLKDYWHETTARSLAVSEKDQKSRKLSFEETILDGISQPLTFKEYEWQANPIGALYFNCGG